MDILECTIRDGSYVLDFQWTKTQVEGIIGELSLAGFKYIETGNGTGLGAYKKVHSRLNDEEYISASVANKNNAKIGAFFIPGIGTKDDLKLFKDLGGDFIRIGTNSSESSKAFKYIEYAKLLDLEVSYNFMKSYVLSPFQLCHRATEIEQAGADIICFVDSAGGLLPKQVTHYISLMKECLLNVRIGFHGHNNLLLANANAIVAIEAGADIIDTTLLGMGRGAGNAQTETMLVIIQKMGINLSIDPLTVSAISEKHITSLSKRFKGSDGMEMTLGNALFHDSYLMNIEKYSKMYNIDSKHLITEISRINRENPTEQLIEKIAIKIKNNETIGVFYPKFYHSKI